MAKAKRMFTARDANELGAALKVLGRHHMRHTENGSGKAITMFEAQIDLMPDVFVISSGAANEVKQLIRELARRQAAPLEELVRIYKLDSGPENKR